jgi:rod shape determining protein RodA
MMARARGGPVLHGKVDWWTILIATVLMALGWLNLYAAVYDETTTAFDIHSQYGMQMLWVGVSLVMALLVMLIDDK